MPWKEQDGWWKKVPKTNKPRMRPHPAADERHPRQRTWQACAEQGCDGWVWDDRKKECCHKCGCTWPSKGQQQQAKTLEESNGAPSQNDSVLEVLAKGLDPAASLAAIAALFEPAKPTPESANDEWKRAQERFHKASGKLISHQNKTSRRIETVDKYQKLLDEALELQQEDQALYAEAANELQEATAALAGLERTRAAAAAQPKPQRASEAPEPKPPTEVEPQCVPSGAPANATVEKPDDAMDVEQITFEEEAAAAMQKQFFAMQKEAEVNAQAVQEIREQLRAAADEQTANKRRKVNGGTEAAPEAESVAATAPNAEAPTVGPLQLPAAPLLPGVGGQPP